MINLELILKELDKDLFNSLEEIKSSCKKIWANEKLYWFTDHSFTHSERIVDLLSQILAPSYNTCNFLTKEELYVLLASIYLHDIGMQCVNLDNKSPETLDQKDFNEIRKLHADKTYELITKQFIQTERDDFSIAEINDQYLESIALVSKGHSTDYFDIVIDIFQDRMFSPNNKLIRGEMLTALLMIADELDLQCSRADFSKIKNVSLSPVSESHWYKHHYVDLVTINNYSIEITLTFPLNSKKYSKLIENEIKNKLEKQIIKANQHLLFNLALKPCKIQTSPMKKELPDAVINILNKDNKTELIDYFIQDFQKDDEYIKIPRYFDSTKINLKTNVDNILTNLYLHFPSNSKFISFYIPKLPDNTDFKKFFKNLINTINDILYINCYMEIKEDYSNQKTRRSSYNLVFTNIIYVYSENEISQDDFNDISKVYTDNKLIFDLREPSYIIARTNPELLLPV